MHEEIKKLTPEEADRVLELPNSYRDAGRVEGREEGREEERKQMVYNMIKKELPEEFIADIAEISVSKVKEMKKKLKL